MSIPLPPSAFSLPDFRNQGIWLRVLLSANGLMLVVAVLRNRNLPMLPQELVELAAGIEPTLMLILALLFLLSPRLHRLRGLVAGGIVVGLSMGVSMTVEFALASAFGTEAGWRPPVAAGLAAAGLLAGFDLRARAHAPALAEARLSALTARIRPHFLFNSLNAVLGVMRDDPRRAEAALEELAELFRVLMRENRELVPLSEEIALARKYVEIERLRLGDRLRVEWSVAACPPETLAPPLLLQPLLENAVHHGIEPVAAPGTVCVRIEADRDEVRIDVDNPWLGEGEARHGNQMALANLRERLMLFHDLEARLDTQVAAGRYRVSVYLPRRGRLRHE